MLCWFTSFGKIIKLVFKIGKRLPFIIGWGQEKSLKGKIIIIILTVGGN